MMVNRIDIKLRALRDAGQSALVPFVTVGFPDIPTSEALAEEILNAGADMLELGIPFSDPLADGPTIQKASFWALNQGGNVHTSLKLVQNLRGKGVGAPLILMSYYNPLLRYDTKRFARDASNTGVDGIIVPDLPPEEAIHFKESCEHHGIYLIPMVAPTSTDQRIAQACKDANGFIYCVSLAGVTGERQRLAVGLPDLVHRIRLQTDLPVVVGFGVSRREHVEAIGRFADGSVVASALINAIEQLPNEQVLEAAREFVTRLRTPNVKKD